MIYPTGGKTKFIFEANQNGTTVGGGLRIKAIENYADKNATQYVTKKVYQYNQAYFVNATTLSNLASAGFIYKSVSAQPNIDQNGNPGSPQCYDNVQTESITENMSFMLGSGPSNIAYTEVEIKAVDGSGNANNGKTVKTFTSQPDEYQSLIKISPNTIVTVPFTNSFYALPAITKAWQRGQLLSEKVYKNSILIKETTNTYQDYFPNYKAIGYVARTLFQPDISGLGLCGSFYSATQADGVCSGGVDWQFASQDHIYEYKRLETEIGYRQLMTTNVKDYTPDGLNALSTTTSYVYSADHNRQHLLSKTMNDSKGKILVTTYQYPNDVSGTVYSDMVSKNIITPIITETTTRDGNAVVAMRKNYALFNRFPLLQSEESKVESGPWITSVTFNTYDNTGNPTKLSTRSGQITSLAWFGATDYGKTDLLNTMTTGGGTTGTVLSRSMSYDYLPLVGLSIATDLNGYRTRYEYDIFQRLKALRDDQNNILKDLRYHYQNQSTPTGIGASPATTMNYVLSRTARVAQSGMVLTSDVDSSQTMIQFSDGLGRALQGLLWKASPDKLTDILVSTSVYDAYGRANKGILPTPSNANTGAFKSNAETLASSFYDADTYPFTETVFEPSPLNRPEKMFGAGQAWRVAGNEKFTEVSYRIAGTEVIDFKIQSDGKVNYANTYPASSLYNQVNTSERGFLSIELKDNEGRVTHKFQQLKEGFVFAITAYAYDNVGLRYVIPPEMYRKLDSLRNIPSQVKTFDENDVMFKEGMYGYVYDTQNRLITKHLPGGGYRYSVYDKQDREVMFADGSDLAKGYWQFQKFDALGRKIQGGIKTGIGSVSRTTLQTAFDGMTTETYEEIGTGLLGYTNRSFPTAYAIVDADVKMVTYYDNYGFNTDVAYSFQSANAFHAQGLTKGLMTGMLVRNIETNAWYKSVNYFDYKSRPIQSFSQNHLGGIDRSEYQYRFNGEVLKMRMVHQGIKELYEYSYNHIGLKTSFTHNSQVVAKYEYDGIGRLQTKRFKPVGTSQGSK